MKLTIWLLYLVVVVYNILDVYQTNLLLEEGAREVGPLMAILYDSQAMFGVAVFKFTMIVYLGVVLIWLTKTQKPDI